MNAIEMRKSDHTKVKNLFEQYDAAAAQGSRKQDLADQIFHDLEAHSRLEQEVFSPAVEAKLAAQPSSGMQGVSGNRASLPLK